MTANHRALEEIDIELIERIKLSPSLYDTRHPDFRLVYRKDQQWQSIADGMGMSEGEARKRWTVLRDRYARELKQVHLNPHSIEFGKNEFFCRMDFLRNFVKKRRERKRLVEEHSSGSLKVLKLDNTSAFPFETVDLQTEGQLKLVQRANANYVYKDEPKQEGYGDQVQEELNGYEAYGEHSYDSVIMENNDTSCPSSVANSLHSASTEAKPSVNQLVLPVSDKDQNAEMVATDKKPPLYSESNTDREVLFSRVIASYLRSLSLRYKIKAKVEMMQILEKYIELEEIERR